MLFDKRLYYNKIKTLEGIIEIKTVVLFVLIIVISILLNHFIFKTDIIKVVAIAALIGILFGYLYYINKQCKVEEMKMKLDIYNMIEDIKNDQE